MRAFKGVLAVVVSLCVGALVLGFGAAVALAAAPETPVTSSPAKSITATSATLEGVLNPAAPLPVEPGSYEFLYRQSASECRGEGERSTGAAEPAGLPAEAVSAGVGELLPNATYTFCLLARNAEGEAVGSPVSFTTLQVQPSVEGLATTNVTASSADLTARIDPNGSDTTYRFEYGTSSAYGASVPVPNGDAGAGHGVVAVSEALAGLSANVTTYHWRLVASSAGGTTSTADQTFVYDTTGGGLPDGRQYEMVTPVQKNGALVGEALIGSVQAAVSEDGSHVLASFLQCFGEASGCTGKRTTQGAVYDLARTGEGWSAGELELPAVQFGISSPLIVSLDGRGMLFSAPTAPADEDDFYVRQPDGLVQDIGPVSSPAEGAQGMFSYAALPYMATADLSHVVWAAYRGFLWPFDETERSVSSYESVYEYVGVGNRQPALVSVSGGPGSTSLIGVCGSFFDSQRNALSADGNTVYFTVRGCGSGSGANSGVPVPASTVYARIEGSRTVPISVRSPLECTGACLTSTPSNAEFWGASADGSKAFFLSAQQLTDAGSEGSQNLYEYDFANPAGRNLIVASAGDRSGEGPRVQGVVAISADGSHVYFVAQGVLTPQANAEGQVAQNGANNLYVFERDAGHPAGRVAFVATLGSLGGEGSQSSGANVTPDGRFLVFTSAMDLTADTSSTGVQQVFRYDAQTGRLVRISTGERGFDDNGNAGTADASIVRPYIAPGGVYAGPERMDPTMSNDGSFVFFQSPVGLTPRALNDVPIGRGEMAENVYEWHEGQVYLISDGRDLSSAADFACGRFAATCLLGSDATGANVFFTTADRLVGQDTDTQVDVYDARVCTSVSPCLSQPASSASECVGEACRGVAGGSPAPPVAGSATFAGVGNLTLAPTRAAVKPGKKRRAARKPRRGKRRRGRGRAGGARRGVVSGVERGRR
jgi:hypothetical protein